MTFERYSRATQSKNLAMSDWRTLDVDWIAASGLSQIGGDPLPAMVARWLCDSRGEVFKVLAQLQKTYGKAKTLNNDARDDIVDAADWWHDRRCQDCGGRGHRQIPDTPMHEEAPCQTCGGSGLRGHSRHTHAYSWTLQELDRAAVVCGRVISERVA